MSEVKILPRATGPKCKHFTGIGNDVCRAGVKYTEVAKDHDAIEYRHAGTSAASKPYVSRRSLPCIVKHNLGGAVCEKCELPTAEEEAAEEREMQAAFERMVKARAAIVAHLGPWKKGQGSPRGAIDCPCCGQQRGLAYSRAGSNGHIHARCVTPGCVSWME